MMTINIEQPFKRSFLRRIAGREYYILKRKIEWFFSQNRWSSNYDNEFYGYSIFDHKSVILRSLNGVDLSLQENKRINLQIAINYLDSITIAPGETFSVWKLIGRPTKRKGYLNGLVLNHGKVQTGIGGGLCQLSNLLFWMFAHSPLTIVERHRHGFDVFPDFNRTIPFGAGATLAYNHIDLQVRNDTAYNFCLKLWLDETDLNGKILCDKKIPFTYSIQERNHRILQQPWGGYSRHNQIFKITYKGSQKIKEHLLVVNHAIMMYSPLLSKK